MRAFIALGIISLFAFAADDTKKRPEGQQDSPNINPRTRAKTTEPESVTDRKSNIRIDTTMVLIPVAVMDPMSRFVTGLDRENFKLYEDKVEQEILQFSS